MLALRSSSNLFVYAVRKELYPLLSIDRDAKIQTIFPCIQGMKRKKENKYLHAQIKNWNDYITQIAIIGHVEKSKFTALHFVVQEIFQNNALTHLDKMVRSRTKKTMVVSELETLVKNIHLIVQSRPFVFGLPFEGRPRISSLLQMSSNTPSKTPFVRSKSYSSLKNDDPQIHVIARVMLGEEREKRVKIEERVKNFRQLNTPLQKENFYTYYLSSSMIDRWVLISHLNEEELISLFDEICKSHDNRTKIFEFFLSMKLKSLRVFVTANNFDPYRKSKIDEALELQGKKARRLKNWTDLIEEELLSKVNVLNLQLKELNTLISNLENAFYLTPDMINAIDSLQSEVVLLSEFIDEMRVIFKNLALFDASFQKLNSLKNALEDRGPSPVSSSSSADSTYEGLWRTIHSLKQSQVFTRLENYEGDDSFEFLAEYGIYGLQHYIECGLIEEGALPIDSCRHFKLAKEKLHKSGITRPEHFLKFNIHNAYFLKRHLCNKRPAHS